MVLELIRLGMQENMYFKWIMRLQVHRFSPTTAIAWIELLIWPVRNCSVWNDATGLSEVPFANAFYLISESTWAFGTCENRKVPFRDNYLWEWKTQRILTTAVSLCLLNREVTNKVTKPNISRLHSNSVKFIVCQRQINTLLTWAVFEASLCSRKLPQVAMPQWRIVAEHIHKERIYYKKLVHA